MTRLLTVTFFLAFVGAAWAAERHPPTFFLMQVVEGEDQASGLAELTMEQAWQQQTLSNDPLTIHVELVARYPSADNEGRQCARVKGRIGQDKVPLKGKTYQDCTADQAAESCQPFYVTTELDMCADGLPPTANYAKYQREAADPSWQPPVTAIKGDK